MATIKPVKPKSKRKGFLKRIVTFPYRKYRQISISRQMKALEKEAKEARKKLEEFDIILERFQRTKRLPIEIRNMAGGRQYSNQRWQIYLWNEVEYHRKKAEKRENEIEKLKKKFEKLQ